MTKPIITSPGLYRLRNGDVVAIMRHREHEPKGKKQKIDEVFIWFDASFGCWKADGRWLACARDSNFDIISRIGDLPEVEK